MFSEATYSQSTLVQSTSSSPGPLDPPPCVMCAPVVMFPLGIYDKGAIYNIHNDKNGVAKG